MLIRWHKETNYIIAHLQQDLFGGWVVTQSTGTIGCCNGKVKTIPVSSYQEATALLDKMVTRNKRNGYTVKERSDQPTQLDWILEYS